MSKQIILQKSKQIDGYIEDLRLSAEEAAFKLNDISSYNGSLEFLNEIKFEKIGCDPLDRERPLNFIEQVNQTFTYFASFRASKFLFKQHQNLNSLTLNLGTKSGLDIFSEYDGGIAAEVFAAVNPKNNNKLQKDIEKVSATKAKHKYVFFMCPDFEEGLYPDLIGNDVIIWSLGNDLF